MVEGQPLHYYYSYNYHPPTVVLPEFPYFQQFDLYGYRSMEATDDLAMPGSPNSIQSDSDHSTSSVEVTLKEIKVKKPDGFYGPKATEQPGEKTQVKCCWHSCGLFFPTLDQLGNHVAKVHASGGPGGLYYCGWEGCSRNNKGFNARYKMLVHVRTHTNEKPHQCYQCDKSFSRAENLKIHSRSHSGEKPYVCPVPGCNKAYSNSSDRFKHTRTHQVDKPYQCKVPGCLKRYTDPSSLRKHVKTFKHFAENNHEIKEENRIQETDKMIDSKAEKTTCNCPHVCSMTDCLNKAAEMLRLGAMINLKKQDEESLSWNRFLDPYITPTKSIFHHTYVVDGQADMDVVDMPLDLSIHSKNI